MQLNRPPLRHALALATCVLVHGAAHAEQSEWKTSSSFLYYKEKDRITVLEPALFATEETPGEQTLSVRVIYDSLSGASPSGASVSNKTQTLGSITTAANKLPVAKFSDVRTAVGIERAERTSSTDNRIFSVNVSKENDYASIGGTGNWTHDYNQKRTTFSFSIGGAYDTIHPASSIPTGLQSVTSTNKTSLAQTLTGASGVTVGGGTSSISGGGTTSVSSGTTTSSGSSLGSSIGVSSSCANCQSKRTWDVMVGLTQVLSRNALMQANLSVSTQQGYLTDPYKVVSIVDATTGSTTDYVFEKRPSRRLAKSLYLKFVQGFGEDAAHFSYRYFSDDWKVRAHSVEMQYRKYINESLYLEPQIRYHRQSKAKFFHYSLASDVNLDSLKYASADLRLAEMTSLSAGIKMGIVFDDKTEFSARLVRMVETGVSHPSDAIGIQKSLDMYPKLEATIINASYSMPF